MSREGWSIRLIGGFSVHRPDGTQARFRTRKSEALVALLALNNGVAVSRENLAEALWPNWSRDRQLTNLRQAIAAARAAFAPEVGLEANRDSCRLALSAWSCDYHEAVAEGRPVEGHLLPEMLEPSFESWRTELAALEPLPALGTAASAVLPTLFEWALSFQPSRVLEIARATPELASSLPLPQYGDVLTAGLASTSHDHPLYSWGQLQLCNVRMWQGEVRSALASAKRAIVAGRASGDRNSWVGAVFAASFLYTLRGNSQRAVDLIQAARDAALGDKDPIVQRRFGHALAHVHAYHGDLATSLRTIQRSLTAEPENVEDREWAFVAIHRSCYLALWGRSQEAWYAYDAAERIARRIAHPWLDTQVNLARSYTLLGEGRRDEARASLLASKAQADNLGSTLISLHSQEGLAIAAESEAERKERWTNCIDTRERLGLPLLPLDRLRTAKLLSA